MTRPSVHHPTHPASGLDIPEWTPIATFVPRGRQRWRPVDGAPVTPIEARRLVERGHLLMAQRRDGASTVLVVKTPDLRATSRGR